MEAKAELGMVVHVCHLSTWGVEAGDQEFKASLSDLRRGLKKLNQEKAKIKSG